MVTALELKPGQSPADLLREHSRKPHKYRAQREGHYASKAEARYAQTLLTLKQAGAIEGWLEQVPVRLSNGITYRIDFMVISSAGDVRFVEVKGFATREWKLKMRLLEGERPEIAKRLEVVR
jgi:hypothetical protein